MIGLGVLLATYYQAAVDLYVYQRAGRMMLTGSWEQIYEIGVVRPFKYHPFFALLCTPLGFFAKMTGAKLAWGILSAGMVLDTLRRFRRHWQLDALAATAALCALCHALYWQTFLSNVTFAMLWLWTVAATSPSLWVSSFCYAFLIALKPFWLALILPWVLCRRWDLFGRIAAWLAAMSTAPVVLGWENFLVGYQRWYATFGDPLHDRNFPKPDNQGWFSLLYRQRSLDADERTLWFLAGAGIFALLWFWLWRSNWREAPERERWWWVEVSIFPFILWASPMSWIHHQLLLWPLLAVVWQAAAREWIPRLVFLTCAVLLSGINELVMERSTAYGLLRAGWPLLTFPLLTCWAASKQAALRD